jgi:hypothetical protein
MVSRLRKEIRKTTGKDMNNSKISAGVARVINRTSIIVNENSSYGAIKAVAKKIARDRDA